MRPRICWVGVRERSGKTYLNYIPYEPTANGHDRGGMWLCVVTPRNEKGCALRSGNTCLCTCGHTGRDQGIFFNHCVQWAASQRTLVRVAPMAWMLR